MAVRIDEAGHDHFARRIDNLSVGGNTHGGARADGHDLSPLHDEYAVRDGGPEIEIIVAPVKTCARSCACADTAIHSSAKKTK
jgi:hypothetical protein